MSDNYKIAPDPVWAKSVPVVGEKAMRRAERLDVAKHIYAGWVKFQFVSNNYFEEVAGRALRAADALIAAVDKETNT